MKRSESSRPGHVPAHASGSAGTRPAAPSVPANRPKASDASAEDYATGIERIEFEGTLLHSQMIREGMKNAQWPSSMDLFGNVADYAKKSSEGAAFAKYLEAQKKGGHYDLYIKQAHDPKYVKIQKVDGPLTDFVRDDYF